MVENYCWFCEAKDHFTEPTRYYSLLTWPVQKIGGHFAARGIVAPETRFTQIGQLMTNIIDWLFQKSAHTGYVSLTFLSLFIHSFIHGLIKQTTRCYTITGIKKTVNDRNYRPTSFSEQLITSYHIIYLCLCTYSLDVLIIVCMYTLT